MRKRALPTGMGPLTVDFTTGRAHGPPESGPCISLTLAGFGNVLAFPSGGVLSLCLSLGNEFAGLRITIGNSLVTFSCHLRPPFFNQSKRAQRMPCPPSQLV